MLSALTVCTQFEYNYLEVIIMETMKWEPKKWQGWHDVLLGFYIKGLTKAKELGLKVNRCEKQIRRLLGSDMFQERYQELLTTDREQYTEGVSMEWQSLNENKSALVKHMLDIALGRTKAKASEWDACRWSLEKFPEFSPKNGKVQNTLVYQATPEEREKDLEVAQKMKELANIVKQGENRFIIEEG